METTFPGEGDGESMIKKDGSNHHPIRKPKSKYFKGRNRRYSMVFQGRFKQKYTGDEIVFGVDSNQPLHPIPGVGIGIRICKWLDPALEANLSGNCPHIYSPIVSSMNALSIFKADGNCSFSSMTDGKVISEDEQRSDGDKPTADNQARVIYPIPSLQFLSITQNDESCQDSKNLISYHDSSSEPLDVKPWAFANSNVPELTQLLFQDEKDAEYAATYDKRKKLFGSLEKRKATIISPENIYCMDFYDAYFDLSTFTVNVPGFSLSAFKYWNGEQPLRYRCLTRDGTTVFFCVQFDLVPKSEYQNLACT